MKEYDVLPDLIDQRTDASLPIRDEYFRRYRRGIRFHVHSSLEKTAQEHDRPYNGSDGDSGDAYLDSFARGYTGWL